MRDRSGGGRYQPHVHIGFHFGDETPDPDIHLMDMEALNHTCHIGCLLNMK